jgi:hypothetical protein
MSDFLDIFGVIVVAVQGLYILRLEQALKKCKGDKK